MRSANAKASLSLGDASYPTSLADRLGVDAPAILHANGAIGILSAETTALFCSSRIPGDVILRAHDTARKLRDEGETVVSGFHSPIEKDCLRILLRGKQPIIICPARAIETMSVPTECRTAFENGRILFLSPFAAGPTRVTKESAAIRNRFVAALADRAFVAHATPGGQMEKTLALLKEWSVPLL